MHFKISLEDFKWLRYLQTYTNMDSIMGIDSRLVAIGGATLVAASLLSGKKGPAPPGPPGLPVLGNILDLPKKESWKVYLEWSKQYNSDILCLKVPGTSFFILNTIEIIQDLLGKRSGIYSDRPRSTMLDDLMETKWLLVFMNNTDEWKEHRRIFRREFDNAEASAANKIHELKASRRLLNRLLTTKNPHDDMRLAAVDAILSITYGVAPTDFEHPFEHPFVTTPENVNGIFADVAKGGYLVDVFPALKHLPSWLPGVSFHKTAERGKALARDLLMGPLEQVQEEVDKGDAVDSAASRFLYAVQEGQKMSQKEKDATPNVLGNAYLGGADTTVCALYNFMLAMALYPKVQAKAHKHLDDVLGGQRLPDYSDFESLPYISAIAHELLRWHPVTPFAVYHSISQDDVYEGYEIPKGSIIIPNLYAVMHDERLFGPDTDKFVPERFMAPDGTFSGPQTDIDLAFGFGRRTCPGKLLAKDALWIMVSSVLTAYEISDPVDLQGNPITAETELEFTNAMVSFAPPFKVTFKRRISEDLIQDGIIP